MGTRGSTGGSRTRGSGSGSVDMGWGVSAQGGRSSTRGGFYREWSLAHKVGWHSTGEYNGWLILKHWQLVWEGYGYRIGGATRKKVW